MALFFRELESENARALGMAWNSKFTTQFIGGCVLLVAEKLMLHNQASLLAYKSKWLDKRQDWRRRLWFERCTRDIWDHVASFHVVPKTHIDCWPSLVRHFLINIDVCSKSMITNRKQKSLSHKLCVNRKKLNEASKRRKNSRDAACN